MSDPQVPNLERLLAALRSSSPATRKQAILDLVRGQHHAAWNALQDLSLRDDSVEIRYFASKALNFLSNAPGAGQARDAVNLEGLESAVEALQNPSAEIRLKALQQIATSRNPKYLPALVHVTDAEVDPLVRSALSLAIGILGTKDQIPFIVQKFLPDPNARVRANAIEALERIGDESAYPYIIGFLQDKDNRVRTNAALALNKFGKVNLIRTLEGMLSQPKVWMRDSAAYALQVIKLPEAIPLLERAMQDSYEGIRIKAKLALEGLVARGIAEAQGVLDRFPNVKAEETLEDFLRLGEEEVSRDLPSGEFSSTGDATEPNAASSSEPAVAAPAAVIPPPKGIAYDFAAGDRKARIQEIQKVVLNDDRGMGQVLQDLLVKETDPHVRATLVITLGKLTFTPAADALIALLTDKDARVRANVVEALGLMRHEPAYPHVIKMLKDAHPRVVANAAWTLRHYPFIDIYPVLESMVIHRKDEFRRSAIWLISQLRTFAAMKLLEKLTQDKAEPLKTRAIALLRECKDEGNAAAKSLWTKLKLR